MANTSLWHNLALKAIDLGRQTQISNSLPGLDKSQWLTTELLVNLQISQLQQILAFASQAIPFYRNLFAKNHWGPRDFCSLSDLEKLPVITKDQLRNTPLDFQSDLTENKKNYKYRHTGGSTGEPLPYRVDNHAFGKWWAATFRAWQATGYSFGDRMLTLGGASVNSHHGGAISYRIYNFLRNNQTIPVGHLDAGDINRIIGQLNNARPSLLYGYPSVLYLIAGYIIKQGLEIQSINRVITTSEMLFPGQRKLIEQAFQAPVFDVYGCPEAGLIAGECDQHRGMHYAMENCIVEVLDDQNTRLPNGQTCRLVATNLDNHAMSLIRYDTGDIGALSDEKCSCGRGLSKIIRLEGRSRDLIYTPKKIIIHGVAINHLIYAHPWVDRYQIIQENLHDLSLNLAVSNSIPPATIECVRSELAELTEMNISMTINEPFVETNGKKNRLIISKISIHDQTE